MKKYMPLEGLRWSRDSGSALCDTPQNSRSRTGWGANLSDLTPVVGSNILLLFLYVIFGVGFPLLFMWGFRRGKTIIQKIF